MKNLIKNPILLVACLFGLLTCPASAFDMVDSTPSLPELVQNADTICIGKVGAITQVEPTKSKDGGTATTQADTVPAVAEVAVQSVLKGKISPKSIQVAFFQNQHSHPTFNPASFTELKAGETDMIFLNARGDASHFDLSQPNSHDRSKIVIGDAKIGLVQTTTSPIRAVLLALVNVVASGSKPVKMECLGRIGNAGYILYTKADVYVDEAAVADRLKLGEPLLATNTTSSLEQFVQTQILPPILKLTTDKDDDIRAGAVSAAGGLQDVDVIPEMARLGYAYVLGHYRNPDAVRPLARALGSSYPLVRAQAAYALRNLADPLAVPFLLEHLDDPDPDAQYYIVTALFESTNTPSYPGTAHFQEKPGEYVAFWKKWAVDNQDKVKAWRAQFDAAVPVKPVP